MQQMRLALDCRDCIFLFDCVMCQCIFHHSFTWRSIIDRRTYVLSRDLILFIVFDLLNATKVQENEEEKYNAAPKKLFPSSGIADIFIR